MFYLKTNYCTNCTLRVHDRLLHKTETSNDCFCLPRMRFFCQVMYVTHVAVHEINSKYDIIKHDCCVAAPVAVFTALLAGNNWISIVHRQRDYSSQHAIVAHAQDFVLNDELLLAFLKPLTQRASSLYASRTAWCFQSVTAEIFVVLTSSFRIISPTVNTSAQRQTRPSPRGLSLSALCNNKMVLKPNFVKHIHLLRMQIYRR